MSENAGSGPIPADYLLRWCAECFRALGMPTDHAFGLAAATVRMAQLPGGDSMVSSVAQDMELIAQRAMPLEPGHELQRLSESAARLHDVSGHELFALHAGVEFAIHAAALQGWGAVQVDAGHRPEAVLAYFQELIRQSLCCVAIRAPGPADPARACSTLTIAATDGSGSALDVPTARVEWRSGESRIGTSLDAVLADCGVSFPLPPRFSQDCRPGVQLMVIDPERHPRECRLIELRRQDIAAAGFGAEIQFMAPGRVLVQDSTKSHIRHWSRRLNVFDPFGAS